MKEPRILIIEDYKDFQKALEIQLKNDGFDVITADDGYQGYEIAKQQRPDLIILDVVIPAVNGFHVCRLLKSDMYLKNIPIIMMSGLKKDKVDKDRGLDTCAADEYLFKPFKHEDLLKSIKRLLAKK